MIILLIAFAGLIALCIIEKQPDGITYDPIRITRRNAYRYSERGWKHAK